MLPMLLECSRCLEDGIVETPTEVDLALVYGLGFPPFRGGIFRWADATGAPALLAAAEKNAPPRRPLRPDEAAPGPRRRGPGFHGE